MPDSKFHYRAKPLSLGELADITNSELGPGADKQKLISDVAPLDSAGSEALSFLDNIRYKEQFSKTDAGACIIKPEMQEHAPAGVHLLLTPTPYKAYALAANALYPEPWPQAEVSSNAMIEESAVIDDGCIIEAGAVVKQGAQIGEGTWIEANSVIGENVVIGKGCRINAGCTISHSIIGDNVRLYPGVRVGQDGFGFAIDPGGHVKVPQLGRVIIEDSVQIGANSTIDRGAGPDTVIGQGTWIDNLVQIGHNVKIGKFCIIVAQVGISGSTIIEDYAMLAGQVGIAGHLHIGKGAKVAAQSGVMRDVPAGVEVFGSPAMPMRQALKNIAALNRLGKNSKN